MRKANFLSLLSYFGLMCFVLTNTVSALTIGNYQQAQDNNAAGSIVLTLGEHDTGELQVMVSGTHERYQFDLSASDIQHVTVQLADKVIDEATSIIVRASIGDKQAKRVFLVQAKPVPVPVPAASGKRTNTSATGRSETVHNTKAQNSHSHEGKTRAVD